MRAALGARLRDHGPAALHGELAPDDAVRIKPTDTARILRALEVLDVTGSSVFELRQATTPALKSWTGVALAPDRARLYGRIEARLDGMIAAGALEEVRALEARALSPDLPAMKAMGAPHLLAHLRGETSLAAALDLAKRDTRRYAKRQFTWIAGQLGSWTKIKAEGLEERLGAVFALNQGVDGSLSAI